MPYEKKKRVGLIIIAAPSGGGKTTLCKQLLKEFPELVLSVSSTTRAPRENEAEGIDYFFLNREFFEKQIQAGEFAEWAMVHGNFYGTSKKVIERSFTKGRSVLLAVDVQGAEKLRSVYPDRCLRIFIAPPSLAHLEERLRERGTESQESIQKRLKNAEIELKETHRFDHIVVNDTLEKAYQELSKLVRRFLESKPGSK